MQRIACMLRVAPQKRAAFEEQLIAAKPALIKRYRQTGVQNASVWSVDSFVYGYFEAPDTGVWDAEALGLDERFAEAETIAAPGEMRLMYHDIGLVREDKSLIRPRVFATVLKPGCAEIYKARHDALIAGRDGGERLGPESNFTIWCARDQYIFGYCELVRAYDHEATPEERSETAAWETRQLEIMDWLTDDVDWLTGQTHPAMSLLLRIN